MIARLCAVIALALALPAAAANDWTRVAAPTPAGGILVGNPNAKARFVEIANYTCPHCAHFSGEAAAPIAARIRSGALAVEYRPIILDAVGLAATVVARCAAPAGFLAANDALYARQNVWFAQAHDYADANANRLTSYSELDRLQLLAQRGGIAQAAGLPAEQVAACFADRAQVDAAVRASAAAEAIASGTPTFLVGNQKLVGVGWTEVSARLRAAGMK